MTRLAVAQELRDGARVALPGRAFPRNAMAQSVLSASYGVHAVGAHPW
jgi:hypothetical protein